MTTIFSFVILTALVAVITWIRTRRDTFNRSEGYFLAGRSLSWIVIGGSLMMTNISTEQLVGLNGGAYIGGMVVMAWELLAVIGMGLFALILMPRFLREGITTIPQFLEDRYSRGVRSMVAIITIGSMIVTSLPFVLYTGALALVELVDVPGLTGMSHFVSVMMTAVMLAIVGGVYAIGGGLKAVALSDTINGVGLVLGGLLVTVLGLLKLGDGSLGNALHLLAEHHPEKLSAIGNSEASVPFGTLFTGMLLLSISYWGMNQFIIQRTLGARSLAEGQKGVMFAACLKVVGVGILVLPGIIAFHLFPDLPHADLAYPRLVSIVLPGWLSGFFAAVLFGAILSSYNSALHSLCTLFGVDIYKPIIRKAASENEVVLAGKAIGIVLVCMSISMIPLIANAEAGVFELMKRISGYTGASMMAIVVMAIVFKRIAPMAAYVAVPIGMLIYAILADVRQGLICSIGETELRLHWLHCFAVTFVAVLGLMLLVHGVQHNKASSTAELRPANDSPEISMTPWRWAATSFCVLFIVVVIAYGLFSPLVLA